MKTLLQNKKIQFGLFFFAGFSITLLSGLYSNHYVRLNDFWTILYYGRNMTWGDKESLYNAFYPFGYAFLIGQFPYTYTIQLAYLLNALLSGLLTSSVSMLIFSKKSFFATLLAMGISLLHPQLYEYSNTLGPDIGAAAFPIFAIYLLWKDALNNHSEKTISTFTALLIGASLGLGFLWRTHVIVFSVLIFTFAIIFNRLRRTPLWIALASFACFISIQVGVDLLSGHAPFETGQMFNVYKLLYGMDWANTPSPEVIANFSFFSLILQDPKFVIRSCLPYYQFLASYAILPFILWLIASKKSSSKNFGAFATLTMLLYAFPLSFSDSPRSPIAFLPLFAASVALTGLVLTERARELSKNLGITCAFFLAGAGILLMTNWAQINMDLIRWNRESRRVFGEMEYILTQRGVESPKQVFSTRYAYYMPNRPPYQVRTPGYWSNDWVWGYAKDNPPIPMDSWDVFKQACIEQGIQFLVLLPQSGEQADFFYSIYNREYDEDQYGLTYIAQRALSRMFVFK